MDGCCRSFLTREEKIEQLKGDMEYEVCQSDNDIYDSMESRLMQMAFWAHKTVLFEKIKQKIEEQEGEKLDKVAELLVEASRIRAKSGQEAEKDRQKLKDKLKEAFEE